MKIIRDEKKATFKLVPTGPKEETTVKQIVALIKPREKLVYGGKRRDGEHCLIHLYAGSKVEEKTQKISANVTFTHDVHVGGVELILRGTTKADKQVVGSIRDTCFFGSGGLIFLKTVKVDGKTSLVTTAKFCQHCGRGMIEMGRCEWKTCRACAAACEHTYKTGAVHGGGLDIGLGEYCTKCGMGKPRVHGEREKSQLEHHLAVEKEIGVHVVYKKNLKKGLPFTPKQVVQFSRYARRHAKANRVPKTKLKAAA